ncbi:MAG: competence/damage-inducible protein A [Lentisphaerae bacterium]|nr:competence/damage-inducible protein A [Lentisphaerota bacterium]
MNDMQKTSPTGIGLVIIGSEILDGRRTDSHFTFCRDQLKSRGIPLIYTLMLTDEPKLIEDKLRWCWSRPEPFISCGGIGATPDDYTRACAAAALGIGLEDHPEGLRILAERWGAELTPVRRRLVEFPVGSALIPNPVNRVPGFSIRHGHFVPGFQEMARPMMAWVLDTYYTAGVATARHTMLLPGAREGELIPVMERIVAEFGELSFSSLPRFTATGTEVELSLHGPCERVAEGFDKMKRYLDKLGFAYEVKP